MLVDKRQVNFCSLSIECTRPHEPLPLLLSLTNTAVTTSKKNVSIFYFRQAPNQDVIQNVHRNIYRLRFCFGEN